MFQFGNFYLLVWVASHAYAPDQNTNTYMLKVMQDILGDAVLEKTLQCFELDIFTWQKVSRDLPWLHFNILNYNIKVAREDMEWHD